MMTPIKYLTNQMYYAWDDYENSIELHFFDFYKYKKAKAQDDAILNIFCKSCLPHHLRNMQKLNFFFSQTDIIRVINKKAPLDT